MPIGLARAVITSVTAVAPLALPSAISPTVSGGTPTTLDSQQVASVAAGDTLVSLCAGSRDATAPTWAAAVAKWSGTPSFDVLFGDNYVVSTQSSHMAAGLYAVPGALTNADATHTWGSSMWGPVFGLIRILGPAVSHQLSPAATKGATGTSLTATFGVTPAADSLIIGLVHHRDDNDFTLPADWAVLFSENAAANSTTKAIARIGAHGSATVTGLASGSVASMRLIELRRP